MRSKGLDPCALFAQVNSRSEWAQLAVTYREFRRCFTRTTVAEEPVLGPLGSLRHLHGESAAPDAGAAALKRLNAPAQRHN